MTLRRVLSDLVEEVMSQSRMPPPPTIYSPEERPRPRLRPEAASPSEERPRAPSRPEPASNEELRAARSPRVSSPSSQTPTTARPKGSRGADIRIALSSPAGVRQALVLQEILGPPKSLRPEAGHESGGTRD